MNLSPLQLQRQLAPLRPLGLVALAWLVLLLLFRDTAGAMVEMWRSNDTFAHAFLVLPITLGLVWMRRAHLQGLPVRPQPWLLAVVAVVGAGWLLAELATVGVVAQFALVGLMVTAVPLVLGWAWFQALLFPLFFLFFAVPFGDSAVPQLMEWTADFTVFALKATGIPVYREGLLFVIPSGSWSVVQACSGVRYLIASFMVGTLFAYLNYVSLRRRLLFVLVSLLVPIVANWLRAYMIVMIGHLSNNELAAGVDHLIYGWVFFGLVIGAMFWVGSRWAQAPLPPSAAASTTVAATPASAWVGAGLFVAALLAVQGLTWQLSRPSGLPPPALSLATLTSPQWQPAPAPTVAWTPGFLNPLSVATGHWQQDGRTVSVWLGYYRDQGPDRKLVSSFNGLAGHDDKVWAVFGLPGRAASGELPAFRRSDLRQGKALDALKAQRMRVWHLYWIGGRWVTSDVRAKLYQAVDRVQGRGDDGAVVVLYTPAEEDADATLEKFARQRLGALGTVLAAARETR